jgi:glutamate 5-kinase
MQFRENIKKFQYLVIKVGSNVITDSNGDLDHSKMETIASDISLLKNAGIKVVLITSGAISAGRKLLSGPKKQIEILQAQSSIGQPILMNHYASLFHKHQVKVAQLLLTHDDFKNRQRFLNARNTISTLLNHNFVPILNENDAVSFTEITLGDNDHLAAMTAQMIGADLLLLITSSDGLYTDDPSSPHARKLSIVEYGDDLSFISTKSKTPSGRGGMASKLLAVQKVTPLGIEAIIAPKDVTNPIINALTNSQAGSVFRAIPLLKSEQRKAWLVSTQKMDCGIYVDAGAYQALKDQKKSLLPKGILKVKGSFLRGDCIPIYFNELLFALGLVEYSDKEVNLIKGHNSAEIDNLIGHKLTDEVIHKDNLLIKDHV